MRRPHDGDLASLFLYAAVAIPVFYLPALFYGPHTNFAVIDNWRFWIIHLWVEGFFASRAAPFTCSSGPVSGPT
jgi:nitric oxide reductase subunit B